MVQDRAIGLPFMPSTYCVRSWRENWLWQLSSC